MDILNNDLERLDFENIIWIIFIVLAILNILGDNLLKDFIVTNDKIEESYANKIFLFVLVISLFIYIYFFIRNYNAFEKASDNEKNLFAIKLLGSALLIAGIICLIYFQSKQVDFVGAPAI